MQTLRKQEDSILIGIEQNQKQKLKTSVERKKWMTQVSSYISISLPMQLSVTTSSILFFCSFTDLLIIYKLSRTYTKNTKNTSTTLNNTKIKFKL